MKEFLDFVRNLLCLILVLWLLFYFVVGAGVAASDDMSPRIKAGDLYIYYKMDSRMSIRDIVVFRKNGTAYVGRVIAQGGDIVDITEDQVLKVNDHVVSETDIFYRTPPYEGTIDYPLTLKQDEVFILCDMREGGKDSRYFGPVNRSEILGTLAGTFRGGSV